MHQAITELTMYSHQIEKALALTLSDKDINSLAVTFLQKARENEMIAIYAGTSKNLSQNLFELWQIIMLGCRNLDLSKMQLTPFIPRQDLENWLCLVRDTLDEHFQGEAADVAKTHAKHCLQLFTIDVSPAILHAGAPVVPLHLLEVLMRPFKNFSFPASCQVRYYRLVL